ncbi:hypothetical protein [Pelosinus sp. UFO1]|uniref:hypothetical protein n=1 Tax=Pelosinus sp. UFO1 TaxID=484770 RepID=UPI0004D13C52|nr:hypothetical protein [Pelosinus sp. UFO1]AIF51669.1 hypothetical protein UFO1_2122 [Pelosinus sp. UFO1]
MKKIIILAICLFTLVSGIALAKVDKSLSENGVTFINRFEYQLSNTDKIAITLIRCGYFDRMLGITKTGTIHNLNLFLYPIAPPYISTEVTFTTKNVPYFLIFNKEVETKQTFKISSVSSNELSYEVDNKSLQKFVAADKVNLVLPSRMALRKRLKFQKKHLKNGAS